MATFNIKTLLIISLLFISIKLLAEYIRISCYKKARIKEIESGAEISPNKFLLVMMTCFKDGVNYTHHRHVHRIIIREWKKLSPHFHQVAFSRDILTDLSKFAAESGWDVIKLNRSVPSGAPYFKDMYKYAFENYRSVFYSFINGDILFDDSLISTLKTINDSLTILNNNVLIIGQRSNYKFTDYFNTTIVEKNNLQVLAKNANRFEVNAEDFFIFSLPNTSTFDWQNLKDVVIGRPAYDNYIVGKANMLKVNTIDATETLLALHLSHPRIAATGFQNNDSNVNAAIIGGFNYMAGTTKNSKYKTLMGADGKVRLVKGKGK